MGAAEQAKKEDFRIFIVEDDYIYNKLATLITQEIITAYNCPDLNFEIRSFTSAQECAKYFYQKPKIVLMDYFFEISGNNNITTAAELLGRMKREGDDCEIIIISGLNDLNKIVELIEMGVHRFILKDHDSLSRLRFTLHNVVRELVDKHYLA